MGSIEETEFVLPLIDFAPFLSGSSSEKRKIAEEVTHGFKTAGFIYLQNYGIAPPVLEKVFSTSASFFDLPQADKNAISAIQPVINRGYIALGREKLTESEDEIEVKDIKESFEIGREGEDQDHQPWPTDEKFKTTMCDFFEQGQVLHMKIMSAIAIGLGLDESFFDSYGSLSDNTLRLLHYPSVRKEKFTANEKQVRAGAHTDYGDITILFQDDIGGLQVKSPNGKFVNVTPIPGTVVVNAGDLLARWSNDIIKSTMHRVVKPAVEQDAMYPARYSIAYFCQPNLEKWIEGIPGTAGVGQKNKYEPVQSGKYLDMRLHATHVY